jgi:excisionase family DNA binding protein
MPRSSARTGPQLLTPSEVAELLSVSTRTITNWINADRIPYVTLPGNRHRVPLHALLSSLGGNYDLTQDLRDAREHDRSEVEARAEQSQVSEPEKLGRV